MLDTPDRASRTSELGIVTSQGGRRPATSSRLGTKSFRHLGAVNRVSTAPSLGYASGHLPNAVDVGTASILHPSTATIVSCLVGRSAPLAVHIGALAPQQIRRVRLVGRATRLRHGWCLAEAARAGEDGQDEEKMVHGTTETVMGVGS